jgi:hypothetical protein
MEGEREETRADAGSPNAISQTSVDGMSMQQLTGQTPGQAPYSVWEFIPFPVLKWNYKLGQPFVGQTNVTPTGNVS